MPGGQPVEAVDEVDGVDGQDHEQHGQQDAGQRVEHQGAADRQPHHLDAQEGHRPRRQHLSGELRRRVQAEAVVQQAQPDDQRRADHQCQRLSVAVSKTTRHPRAA